ncbi:hypothetical protein [Euzebya rosea]|uniref:hypothetical protein n=1 Tax=Euzebya rosea TaxID=2052804 RepID=UPI000D3E4012|nr:hypothetical protein [Euzebya rosea]
MPDRPMSPETTSIVALLEARSPVIRYIGQSMAPRPTFVRHARGHAKDFRRVVLHEAVEVGDVASYVEQEEIAHAIRSGHPLLNELGIPVDLVVHEAVRSARDRAIEAIAVGDGRLGDLPDLLEADRAMCADRAEARTSGVHQPLAHPAWRLDVRPLRTGVVPPGFAEVVEDPQAEAPLLDAAAAGDRAATLLERFAVVTTPAGLEAIAAGHAMWATGQRARHNRDATAARFVFDDVGELRLPRREVGVILDRHVPGATDRLAAVEGMEPGRRDSLVLRTRDPEVLDALAVALIDMAVDVDASPAKPVRQRTTSHDTQQVLLRASQALVLAEELRRATA